MRVALLVLALVASAVLASPEATSPPTPAPAVFFMTFHTDVDVADPDIVLNVTRAYAPHGACR